LNVEFNARPALPILISCIQDPDALARFAAEKPMYAVAFEGERFDAGNKAGFLAATLHFAGKHPELRRVLRRYMRKS
jgi:UTP--glucose-1-phosphate uridylyltransferase